MLNKENPLVSIIIPIFNNEKYIHQCIDSVLNQPYQNIEVILVDDGSTDMCPQICDNYGHTDPRVKVIHKKNGGAAEARNYGIKMSSGEYLIFMDSDDFWVKEISISQLINKIKEHDGFDFILFGMINFYQKSRIKSKSEHYPECIQSKSIEKIEKLKKLQHEGIFPTGTCDKLVKRNFIIQNDLFFKVGYTGEDILWFIDIIEHANNFSAVNEYYYTYRKEVDTAVTNDSRNLKNLVKIIFEISDKYKNNNSKLSPLILGNMAYQYLIAMTSINEFPIEVQKKFKTYSWLLKYNNSKKVKFANKFISIFGNNIAILAFRFYIKFLRKLK